MFRDVRIQFAYVVSRALSHMTAANLAFRISSIHWRRDPTNYLDLHSRDMALQGSVYLGYKEP